MSDLDRARAAELRAERIRWRGRSRRMSRASRNMDERLRRMNEQASLLDKRLHRTLFTEALGRYVAGNRLRNFAYLRPVAHELAHER